MRELAFVEIAGNPNIKREDKPQNSKAIYKIKDDERAIEKQKKELQTSPEELEAIRQELLSKMNCK